MDTTGVLLEGITEDTNVELSMFTSTSEYKIVRTSINYEMILIWQWIFYAVLCQFISIFGTSTNIINILCFIKQGFKDPINVSLLGLAISDLGCLVTLIWTNICMTPAFSTADLPFNPVELQYLTSGWPHVTFSRVSSWITALITLERCVCIIAPLKVRSVITSKRTSIIVTIIFIILISSVAPVYTVNSLDYKFSSHRNRTLISLVTTNDREQVEKISFLINNVFLSFSAFLVITICTILLVLKLRSTTRWRKTSAGQTQTETVSNRNQKVSKMVVMISTLFIACFVPVSGTFFAMSLEFELSINGRYSKIALLLAGFGLTLESINSSMNIFIYYRMSSKYRATFRQLFDMYQK